MKACILFLFVLGSLPALAAKPVRRANNRRPPRVCHAPKCKAAPAPRPGGMTWEEREYARQRIIEQENSSRSRSDPFGRWAR